MDIKLTIRRQGLGDTESYNETFLTEADENDPVIVLLQRLNKRDNIVNIKGEVSRPVVFEQSCCQKQCGSCAMVINDVPGLACASFVKDLCKKKKEIFLSPLSKFPVIEDLKVDRSIIYETMKEMKLWVEKRDDKLQKKSATLRLYKSASCIMCGCCLEVCPAYSQGDKFCGANGMNAAQKILTMEKDRKKRKELIKASNRYGNAICSKSLGCEKVCPAKIPLSEHISRLYSYYF